MVPVQSGNSGGPLFDMNGQVVGIVVAKLNAMKIFKWTGDLPENVNYAIKIGYLDVLLERSHSQNRLTNDSQSPQSLEEVTKRVTPSIAMVIAE